ncbi:MAG: YbaN family protein [Planctomycetota bacterium]|jgi:hypothetical protein|nr:YbaN family protein [Planctomycetota bacterium]
MSDQESDKQIRGPVRLLFLILGFGFLALAWLGFVLPGLPGTPFLLLASYFWVRSSPRLHQWLLESRYFGPLLRDWQNHRAVRPSVKTTALVSMVLVVSLSIILGGFRGWLLAALVALALVGLVVVVRLPVVVETDPHTPSGRDTETV